MLGLGGVGHALADRLHQQGYDVVVWNRTPGKGGALPEARSATDAAGDAEVVIVAVREDVAVRQVCSRELLHALGPDAAVLIVTTAAPETIRELDAQLPGRMLDTPVIGSPQMIRDGQATLLVGGGERASALVFELLDDLSAGYTRCGPPGGGMVMKIVSNLQLVLGVAALAEAVAIARAQGLGDDVVNAVFGESIMVSHGARMGLAAMLNPGHDGPLGPVASASTDVTSALALAGDNDLLLAPTVLRLLERVATPQWPDFSAVIEGLQPRRTA